MATSLDATTIAVYAHKATYNSILLGYTAEGSVVSIERSLVPVATDQSGINTNVRVFATGMRVTAKLNLLQYDLDNLKVAMNELTKFTGGPGEKVGGGKNPGYVLTSAVLTLHPVALADADVSENITFFKAVAVDNVDLSFKNDAPIMIPVTFEALWDQTRVDGNRLFAIGDPTAS